MKESCYCGVSVGTVPYAGGSRCPAHTPAALAGQPEPGGGRYCAPYRCYCGRSDCDSSGSYVRPLEPVTATVVDLRAVASGKRRSALAEYRNAQAATTKAEPPAIARCEAGTTETK